MKAAVLHNIKDLRYEEVDTPEISDEEALIKVKAAGICNSDVPRVKTKGAYNYPVILGHEFCGIVEKINTKEQKKKEEFPVGTRVVVFPLIPCRRCVYCEIGKFVQCDNYNYLGSRTNGGFAEYVKVPLWNIIKIPENVSYEEAALTEPFSVALHAVRRFGMDIGDNAAVYGCGPIGLAVAQLLKIHGVRKLLLVDILKKKLEFAEKIFGFKDTINAMEIDPVEEIKKRTEGLGVDLCIESAGTPVTFEQCIRSVRKFGKVVFLGNHNKDINIPAATASSILRNQILMTGSWNSVFTELPKNEWKTTLHFVSTKQLNVKALISHKYPLKKCNEAFDMMFEKKEFYNKVLFTF